ncbi:MAG: polymerase sigma factor, sigma-70 family [Candidatus Taylorbacteria bacterium]|nr:polymerase sigma factor, sigma-70 family [Candidatus Taylorbacteria bacterium]
MEEQKNNFIKAYEENADALFRHCLFNIRDREVAKDVLQDTFTKTWNYVVGGGQILNLKAFFYQTMKNLIIDYYRKKKSVSLDALSEDENFDPPAPVEVSIEEHSESLLAFRLLDKIPEEFKSVIVMRCVQELSFREISELTGEPENTVAVRYHRAIKKIKKLFNHDEPVQEYN